MILAQILVVNFLLERQTVRVLTGAPASEPPLVAFTEVGGWMLASTREQLSAWRIAEQYRLKAEAGEDKEAYAKRRKEWCEICHVDTTPLLATWTPCLPSRTHACLPRGHPEPAPARSLRCASVPS